MRGGEEDEEEKEEEESSDEDLEELVDFEDDVKNENTEINEEDNVNEDTNKCTLKTYTMSQWPIIDNLANFSKGIDDYFNERGYKKKSVSNQNNCQSRKIKTECHHNLPSDYISPDTPYRGLILFHSLGSGKTLTSFKVIMQSLLKRNLVGIFIL